MLRILIVFLILVAGFFAGPLLQFNQGAASFTFANYQVEMSFTTFFVLQLLFLLLLYVIYSFFRKIIDSKTAFGNWLRSKIQSKSSKLLEQAQLLLLEGDYQKAMSLFGTSAKNNNHRALGYLFDAQAKIDANQFVDAYQLLEQAEPICKAKEKSAFQMVQLKLQIKNQKFDLAEETVAKLLSEKTCNPEIFNLASQLYLETDNFKKIIALLPMMQKAGIYSEAQFERLKNKLYLDTIEQFAAKKDYLALISWWKAQPKTIKQEKRYQQAIKVRLEHLTQIEEAKQLVVSLTKSIGNE